MGLALGGFEMAEQLVLGAADTQIESPPVRSLAAAIFQRFHGEDDSRPVILGCLSAPELRPTRISMRQLRHLVLHVTEQIAKRGIVPGDTVALIRLPRTCETLTALVYLGLSAYGVRVLFPMYVELEALDEWLQVTGAKLVLASPHEVEEVIKNESDVATSRAVRASAARLGLPLTCIYSELGLVERLETNYESSPALDDPRVASMLASANLDTESLLLTTSGTSGKSKIVRYRQGAFIRSCVSWERAGFFDRARLGGRCLCLLLGHSMGLRALWNAVWTREAVCLITPEWFLAYPERVRSLLVEMKPEHVTGGPTVFNTLLEFARVYPDLGRACFTELKCLVSSGAPYSSGLARRIASTFGLELHNGLGLTETLQVACTLVGGRPPTIGLPLPGVRLRLSRDEGLPPKTYRLETSAPFGFAGYLGRKEQGEWFDTGDLVERTDAGLVYVGREKWDFLKDGTGVKISRLRLADLYAGGPGNVEFVALQHEPGLAAIVFLGPKVGVEGVVTAPAELAALQGFFEARLERLRGKLEEFEMRHLGVGRFAAVAGDPPRTRKGNLKRAEIEARFAALIERLTGRYTKSPGIVHLDPARYASSASVRLTSPRRGALLHDFELDKAYTRGQGDRLYYRTKDGEREVVDFVGGFGGNLLGHAHPAIRSCVSELASGDRVWIFDQGSDRQAAGELARELALRVGEQTSTAFVVRLGSTGSEAVEMALAHAVLERDEQIRRLVRDQKRRFGGAFPERVRETVAGIERLLRAGPLLLLALEHGFHGYSLAARAALARLKGRVPFLPVLGVETVFLPTDRSGDVEEILERERINVPILAEREGMVAEETLTFSRIVAAIAEPVQGEGGIRVIARSRLAELAGHGFPLILDEIQAGLGRCGRFLAGEGVPADYWLLGKALGGGVAKLSALLVERRRYVPRFDELYETTFGGDDFSSRVGCSVLSLIRDQDVPGRCKERGRTLLEAVDAVRAKFPNVIASIRGEGLMLGVELDPACTASSFTLRALAKEEHLGALAAAYLLNVHDVRVLPTLSCPDVLRLEPSAFIDDAAIARLVHGLENFCRKLTDDDVAGLVGFLAKPEEALVAETMDSAPLPRWSSVVESPAPGATRVAFLNHFAYPERELAMTEPSMRSLSMAARRALFERFTSLLELKPFVGFARNLFGGKVWFISIVTPADASTLEKLHRMDYRFLETERIQEAVDYAASLGCRAVSLGGYTSILTANGTAILSPHGVKVTTGNTLAVIVATRRVLDACREQGIGPRDQGTQLAVVGASGNIGSAIARRLCASFRNVVLIGHRRDALEGLRAELTVLHPECDVQIAVDMAPIARCNVITLALGTTETVLLPTHVSRERKVVVVDVSVPSVVSPEFRRVPNVQVVAGSGTVEVPGAPDFVVSSHTREGTAFCCAAEAMLLGLDLERTKDLVLTGDVDGASLVMLERLGEQHGLLH
jgi:acetylornithine/succinyldiaminopimelate/putrescine aminotransferase/predicted amino acid dehydrogenase/acyl-coenzyme A synthetase/AMP-(fatty) acid ligase